MNDKLRKIFKLLKSVIKERKEFLASQRVSLGWPAFDDREISRALDSLLNLRLSQGASVREFEKMCAEYIGIKYAVAVNSGSSANLIALTALVEAGEIKRDEEVIVPAATFPAVVSPILQLGLIPVYVDVDKKSWNIDVKEIERAITKKTRVLMPVHSLGNPADMLAIMKIVKKYKLIVLEDCCEAHGASVGSKKVGSFGDLATWSFFVAHNITTGEGGMVFTNNQKYHEILISLREFGRLPASVVDNQRFVQDEVLGKYDVRYIFNRLGYNVRMTDITASMGIEQLKKLDRFNQKRLAIVKKYNQNFQYYDKFLQLPEIRPGTFHSFYGYQLVVKNNEFFKRSDLVDFLERHDIETRPFFAGCLPDQPGFRQQPQRVVGSLPVSRWLRDNAFFIGCHQALSLKRAGHVVTTFKKFFKTLSKTPLL
jgi:CDP-6-deoxy-D-xylo-4-hexulose-3-dehydrase